MRLEDLRFKLAPASEGGAVIKIKRGYRIKVYNNHKTTDKVWDYFETNENGVILTTPRGCALEYKGLVIERLYSYIDQRES